MRIGIDMLGEQTPSSRHRGIGRYVLNFVSQMVHRAGDHEIVLYYYGGLDRTPIEPGPRTRQVWLDGEASQGRLDRIVQQLVDRNPQELDLYLVLSPLENFRAWSLPRRPLHGMALGALCHDVIPILFPEKYLQRHVDLANFKRSLQVLENYDLILTNSQATKADCERIMGADPRKVVSINAGVDARFWRPEPAAEQSPQAQALLADLGITRPFVFNLSGIDWRKNLAGLIDAFALLPARLRESHQLVLTMALKPEDARWLKTHAQHRGVAQQLVVTGFLPDESIRTLYQNCATFVFPSHYEGFGFPIVEAMRCGAAVVAGDNSSQVQLAGDAALLCDTHDSGDIAEKIALTLDDRELRDELRAKAPAAAAAFSWEATADLARGAFDDLEQNRRLTPPKVGTRRPRLAVFAALPPKSTAAARQSDAWLAALDEHYLVDVFHDADQVPPAAQLRGSIAYHDYRLFPQFDGLLQYDCILYRLADDADHAFAYETMRAYPGIVVLHDFSLVTLLHSLRSRPGREGAFGEELAQGPTGAAGDLVALHRAGRLDKLRHECAQRGAFLNRTVFERSRHVVLTDGWTWARAQATYPIHSEKTALIPDGTPGLARDLARRAALRAQRGLGADQLVVLALGDERSAGLNELTFEAFAALAALEPAATLVIEGSNKDERELRARIAARQLHDRVRFVAAGSIQAREELAVAADLAVHVRRPTLQGEAMQSLALLLDAGVPTIVNDVEGFATLPEGVAAKVRWDAFFASALAKTLCELGCDAQRRRQLTAAAVRHAQRYHDWRRIGLLYKELIDAAIRAAHARPGAWHEPLKLHNSLAA